MGEAKLLFSNRNPPVTNQCHLVSSSWQNITICQEYPIVQSPNYDGLVDEKRGSEKGEREKYTEREREIQKEEERNRERGREREREKETSLKRCQVEKERKKEEIKRERGGQKDETSEDESGG